MTAANNEFELRRQLVHYANQLGLQGLSAGKSGNLSTRCAEFVLITPSAVDYKSLQPKDIVAIALDGQPRADQHFQPSSEWRFHCDLYRQRPDISAVVHAHPTACTALACTGRAIPSFHYMVAVAGGKEIPIADYALFGSAELSENIRQAIGEVNACLLANHGMIAIEKSLASAFNLAVEVETLARQYIEALQLGDIRLLSDEQMNAVINRFREYGQRCD